MTDARRRILHAIYTDGEAWFEWVLACGHTVRRGWEDHNLQQKRARCRKCTEDSDGR